MSDTERNMRAFMVYIVFVLIAFPAFALYMGVLTPPIEIWRVLLVFSGPVLLAAIALIPWLVLRKELRKERESESPKQD